MFRRMGMKPLKDIEQRIAEKAAKQARQDIRDYEFAVERLPLSRSFSMMGINDDKASQPRERTVSHIFEYWLKQNTTNYDAVLQALTDKYIEQYTNDLISRMELLREFLEVQS